MDPCLERAVDDRGVGRNIETQPVELGVADRQPVAQPVDARAPEPACLARGDAAVLGDQAIGGLVEFSRGDGARVATTQPRDEHLVYGGEMRDRVLRRPTADDYRGPIACGERFEICVECVTHLNEQTGGRAGLGQGDLRGTRVGRRGEH